MKRSVKRALSCIVSECCSKTVFLPDPARGEVTAMAVLTVTLTVLPLRFPVTSAATLALIHMENFRINTCEKLRSQDPGYKKLICN